MPPSAAEGTLLSSLRHNALHASKVATEAASFQASSCGATRGLAAAAGASAGTAAAAACAPQLFFTSAAAHGHVLRGHVEQPARVDVILEKLAEAGITQSAFAGQLHQLPPPPLADLEAIREVHSYVDELRQLAERAEAKGQPQAVADIGDPDGVTYVTATSFDDALHAAGAATALVDAVVAASRAQQAQQQVAQQRQQPSRADGSASAAAAAAAAAPAAPATPALTTALPAAPAEAGTAASPAAAAGSAGFSITRPPGHHATADTPLGYCLLNNVALAARHAQRHHGLAKVLILDFDLHHGNGTADIFAADPSVLFVDTHEASSVYPEPPFAPAGAGDMGEGSGRGATINVPLPRHAGEASVLSVFDGVIAPAAERFRPDIILVSAGFDAHWRDPFQQLQFRSSTYYKLAQRLAGLAGRLCGGRLVFMLEGGYHTEAVGESVCEVFLALLGHPSVEGSAELALPHPEPLGQVADLVAELRQVHGLQ